MATQFLIEEPDDPAIEAIDPAIIPTDDGGAIVDFSEPEEPDPSQALRDVPWGSNLADVLPDDVLSRLGMRVVDDVKMDDEGREEWKKIIKEGMDQLGLVSTPRETPFPGACGVVYPLVLEAAIRFQARAIAEMFPEGGPVDVAILGEENEQLRDQAERVRDYLNYLLTERDPDYFDDFDQMMFYLPLQGSAFRKVWRDEIEGITKSRFVPADDAIKSYSGKRITHVLHESQNEVKRKQLAGVYRDVELVPISQESEPGPLLEKSNEIEGITAPPDSQDARRRIFETHDEFEIEEDPFRVEGLRLPYIVTVDEETQKVLSVRRNWRQDDPRTKPLDYFVHYKFFPGLGQYGYGYIHIAGGHARAITSILRQLVDAGQMSNLPALIKAKGALSKESNNVVFAPATITEVETADPSMPLGQAIMPVPFKEPSAALLQMMNGLIESGNRLTSLNDAEVGDGSTQQPVGTVMAMLEQSLQVQSAVRKRMHAAQKAEFRLIAEHEAQNVPPEGYPFNVVGGNRKVMQQDFDQRIDVVPVSDPKNFTAVQRMMQGEYIQRTAAGAPDLHQRKNVVKRVYRAGGIDDADSLLIPDPPPPYTGDPNSENMAAMAGGQLKVRPDQDHESHCTAHLLMLQAPGMMMSPAGQILFRHAVEHELWGIWAAEAQKTQQANMAPAAQQAAAMGVPVQPLQLPMPGQPMPPELENIYAKATAVAMQTVIAKLKAMVPMPPGQQDPAMVQAQTNAQAEQAKDQRERAKLAEDARQHDDEMALDRFKVTQDVSIEREQMQQDVADAQMGRMHAAMEADRGRAHQAFESANARQHQSREGAAGRAVTMAKQRPAIDGRIDGRQ